MIARLVSRRFGVVAALLPLVAGIAGAQSIPNIQNPINKAKAAAEKTSEQIRAAEKAGGAPAPVQKAAPPAQTKAAPPAQQKAQQKAAPPPQKSAAAPQKSAAAPAQGKAQPKAGSKATKADTGTGSVSQAGRQRGAVTLFREAFSYSDNGKRDPFVNLMASGDLRPIFADLTLTGVLFDQTGRRSIAMLVDGSTGQAYGARVGDMLGRMRVTRIGMQDVTFTIDEFGLSRSETLIIDKNAKAGTTPAPRRP